MGAPSIHEWHPWVLQASLGAIRGCSRRPWPWGPLVGAESVHEWPSWVPQAPASGTHGCSMRPCVHECHSGVLQVSKSGPRGRAKRP
jgi:hypothetical protein